MGESREAVAARTVERSHAVTFLERQATMYRDMMIGAAEDGDWTRAAMHRERWLQTKQNAHEIKEGEHELL